MPFLSNSISLDETEAIKKEYYFKLTDQSLSLLLPSVPVGFSIKILVYKPVESSAILLIDARPNNVRGLPAFIKIDKSASINLLFLGNTDGWVEYPYQSLVSVNGVNSLPPGFSLYYDANFGVSKGSNNIVNGWADEYGLNVLSGNGSLYEGPQKYIRLINQQLIKTGNYQNLPSGNSPRSILMLLRYNAFGDLGNGFLYGNSGAGQGTVFSPCLVNRPEWPYQGLYFWSAYRDRRLGINFKDTWFVWRLTYDGTLLKNFIDGQLIDTFAVSLLTAPGILKIAGSLDIAALIIYPSINENRDNEVLLSLLDKKSSLPSS